MKQSWLYIVHVSYFTKQTSYIRWKLHVSWQGTPVTIQLWTLKGIVQWIEIFFKRIAFIYFYFREISMKQNSSIFSEKMCVKIYFFRTILNPLWIGLLIEPRSLWLTRQNFFCITMMVVESLNECWIIVMLDISTRG